MKIRSLTAGLLVAVALAGCARSATGPEARRAHDISQPSLDGLAPDSTDGGGRLDSDGPPPPADTTGGGGGRTGAGGGPLGSGN